ncbi:DUF3006 domain-containing protein [Cohnella herbarum]|uniref:DUF3006 domain-containing protein n=2 Tax=Cohnella herbarum TaxID=2728023 RepID=A0A7Z2ZQ31_9BACL|nr:DUF3006 domain-containing protein [Cohnella herbarum]QJD88086.1 DUF3006 domain-containing protein [Cohnella herbarum]
MERGVIDRFEDETAVIEVDGTTRDFPRASLPNEAKVGDVVVIDNGEIRLDRQDTSKRNSEINRLMDELFE